MPTNYFDIFFQKSMIQDLTDIDGVVPVKHSYVNVSATVRYMHFLYL